MRSLLFVLAAVISNFVSSAPLWPQINDKKLIEFGWDEPGTQFMKAQLEQMRRTPFDGCVFHVNYIDSAAAADDAIWAAGGSGNFTWQAWRNRAFTEAELNRASADLQSTDFTGFEHNFLRVNVTPGTVDWFDDFTAIINNFRLAAKLARVGRCAGIMFDTEQYEGPIFNYRKQRSANSKSWDLYAAQARRRGAEMMSAMQQEFPGITLMLTFGHTLPWLQSNRGQIALADCDYGLLVPFLDGMIAAAEPPTKLVDGYELSYGYRQPEQFASAYRAIRSDVSPVVSDPAKYAQIVSAGFGIWMDYDWRSKAWNTSTLDQNHFSPATLETSVRAALRTTDKYVWIYSETPRWWTPEGTTVALPTEYVQAIQQAATPQPPKYLPAKAYYILPETHNNQSGYFSLSEGLDGNIHIGTAKYGENAFLVEFDPRKETQRSVLDTNKVCGVSATGYAAQAKIHTRNWVGDSGKIYVGSKQGYRLDENDKSEYPGGFVMAYDPRIDASENLGMPFPGQGIADVAADESRGLTYVVTCEDQHWMLGSTSGGNYRELGPLLTPYAMTLITPDGKAHAITHDFQLATYDPQTQAVQVRPIELPTGRWTRANNASIPTWVLTADRKRAFCILMNDPTLLEIDLSSGGGTVPAKALGRMIEGKEPDSRCGLDLGADGNVYAVIRINNETGFGTGYLHHLVRYIPSSGAMEDLGVLTVENPNFFEWDKPGPDGKPQPYIHGFHKLPDGTLTPMHAHMSLMAAEDNTLYVTIIYPFTLLRINQFRIERPKTPPEAYCDWVLDSIDKTESEMAEYTRVAEIVAQRHIQGGLIGFPFESQALAQDLWGRSGGMVHIGFTRPWKQDRTDAERAQDVGIVGYDQPPGANDLTELQALKSRGVYLIGFGPRSSAALQPIVATCDAWFDTGLGDDDRVVDLGGGRRGGHGNTTAVAFRGATLIAEIIGALTRQGRMPTVWRGYAYADGRAWGEKYFGKMQFHDDLQVAAQPAGQLGSEFLRQIRYPVRRIRAQAGALQQATQIIAAETAAQRKTFVVWQGHMPPMYIAKREDAAWAIPVELHPFLESQVDLYRKTVPDGALVLNLGYHGLDPIEAAVRKEKQHRVIHMSGGHPDPAWQPGPEALLRVDLGYAFGDSCVTLEGYPQRLFAPSGIAQVVAFECIAMGLIP